MFTRDNDIVVHIKYMTCYLDVLLLMHHIPSYWLFMYKRYSDEIMWWLDSLFGPLHTNCLIKGWSGGWVGSSWWPIACLYEYQNRSGGGRRIQSYKHGNTLSLYVRPIKNLEKRHELLWTCHRTFFSSKFKHPFIVWCLWQTNIRFYSECLLGISI